MSSALSGEKKLNKINPKQKPPALDVISHRMYTDFEARILIT